MFFHLSARRKFLYLVAENQRHMIHLLSAISNGIHKINEWAGRATAWLTVVLVAVVCFDVISRKLFNFTKIWITDLEWHLFALIFLLAAGYALKHNRHVRVDLFYDNYSKKDKALTDFIGTLLFLIPWCVVVIIYSYSYAMESFRLNEGSAEPGGLPARYLIKFCITFGTGLLLLQALATLIDTGLVLFDKKKQEPEDTSGEII